MNRAPAKAAERSVTELIATLEPGTYGIAATLTPTTLAELGANLPVGRVVAGEVVRSFAFRKPSMAVDIAVGEARESPDVRGFPARECLAALAEALEGIGASNFREMKGPDRILELAALPYADVTYLLLYWAMTRRTFRAPRVPAAGRVWKCPECRKPIRQINLDIEKTILGRLDWTAAKPPRAVVRLAEPYTYGTQTAAMFVQGPPPWGRALWDLSAGDIRVKARMDVCLGAASVVGTEEGKENAWARMPVAAFMDLPTWDGEALAESARLLGGNLQPFAPYQCKACNATLHMAVSLGELDPGFS